MQKPMTRTELKNFAAKMRRMITAAVREQVELPELREWYRRLMKADADLGAAVEETAYDIFYHLAEIRYLEARGFLAEIAPLGETEPLSLGRFSEISRILNCVMPDAYPFFHCVRGAFLPSADTFWAEAYADFRTLFREKNPDVRTLGWLHQFYHAEKKEGIIRGVKRGDKITGDEIKIATQIFTPEWISEFLVQNTLRAGGEWYIPPEAGVCTTADEKPILERTFCDPACGSGNMLVAAFDVFFEAYRAAGVPKSEIPAKILSKNLFGMDIDPRMTALTAFSLMMKAWEHDPAIFGKNVRANVCTIQMPDENGNTAAGVLFRPELSQAEADELSENLSPADPESGRLRKILRQISFLTRKYDAVVTNPPYMGSRGMDAGLVNWLERYYPDAKKDLFAAFIVRNMEMVAPDGHLGFMAPFVWMFISSYKKLRKQILTKKTLTTLIQLEYSGFEGATVPICAFTLKNSPSSGQRGAYIRLTDFRGTEKQAPQVREAVRNPDCGWFYRADQADFLKIPGFPVAYWLTEAEFGIFENVTPLSKVATPRQGCATSDNARFLRLWHEVPFSEIAFGVTSREEAQASGKRWFPYNKGGAFRKWYGNQEYVIDWANDGDEIKSEVARRYPYLEGNTNYVVKNQNYYFRESLSWSKITSSGFSLRYYPPGFAFDVSGCSLFCDADHANHQKSLLGCLNSPVMTRILNTLAPTLNFEVGQVAKFPLPEDFLSKTAECVPIMDKLIEKSTKDWDSCENSWQFQRHPIFEHFQQDKPLCVAFDRLLAHWQAETAEMRSLEEENNRIFLQAYNLDQVMPATVPLREVTLRANPHYRYMQSEEIKRNTATQAGIERRLLYDTLTEFISYAVGCFFGRYSPDSPGLILADAAQTADDFQKRVPHARFLPVADNIIVTSESGTHPRDATSLLQKFISTYFGKANLCENITFFEEILGRPLTSYFRTRFFHDHNKSYKNRPVYWFFTSPAKTFSAMIYAHRFSADLPRRLHDEYLLPLLCERRNEYDGVPDKKRISPAARARLEKQIAELETYAALCLQPLLENAVKLDLNDGILANYAKMGSAVRKIT